MNIAVTKAAIINIAVIFLLTIIVSMLCIKLLNKMLRAAGCIKTNYRGKEVTYAMGIAFVPLIFIMSTLYIYFYPMHYILDVYYLAGVSTIGFSGLVDDMIGEIQIKGIRKHISCFLHGQLTTGFIKAFIGVLISIIISIGISKNIFDFILNIFIIALFINTLNLMDLRPGRCAKVFLLIAVFIFASNINNLILILPLGITITIAAVYIFYDLKELCMLGDTGSNILGLTLGYYSAFCYNASIKVIFIFILLIINIAAERISITAFISRNKLLNCIDGLGRSKK